MRLRGVKRHKSRSKGVQIGCSLFSNDIPRRTDRCYELKSCAGVVSPLLCAVAFEKSWLHCICSGNVVGGVAAYTLVKRGKWRARRHSAGAKRRVTPSRCGGIEHAAVLAHDKRQFDSFVVEGFSFNCVGIEEIR